jgi:ribosomal protein L32
MAVPKKKSSKSRRNMRRFSAAYQLETTTITNCPTCNEPVRTHRFCSKPECYNTRRTGAKAEAPATR